MNITINYVKKELTELKRVTTLLCKGKGSLSDYLLVSLPGLVGLISGYFVW